MNKVFDMKTQLNIGQKGEELFLHFYSDLKRLDGKKGDFVGMTGRVIELKTESRNTTDTANFFIEKIRNEETGLLGGPWQALEHGAYYFVVQFADGIVYWYRTQELVDWLVKNELQFKTRRIVNRGWSAVGLLVPRYLTEPILIRKERIYERSAIGSPE